MKKLWQEKAKMKLALLGASLDPPHRGHDALVRAALAQLDIDRLVIMPTFLSPFKRLSLAPAEKRFDWAQKLWGGLAGVEISPYELAQKRPVPSIQSVEYLRGLYSPEHFYLIIGADHLPSLAAWTDYERLEKMVEFIIATRSGIAVPPGYRQLAVDVDITSSFLRESFGAGGFDEAWLCELARDEIKEFYERKN